MKSFALFLVTGNEIKNRTSCFHRKSTECKMQFHFETMKFYSAVQVICNMKEQFDKEKACYKKAIKDDMCVKPIIEAMKDRKETEDFIRANKKICDLFEPYSDCVKENVEQNCKSSDSSVYLFNRLYKALSKFVCEKLILSADDKDSRPDNFGMLNVYEIIVAIYEST